VQVAAEQAGWRAASRPPGRGQGIAFSRYKNTQIYSAVVVEVEVDCASGIVRVLRAVAVADAGQIINPDGLRNQLQGGITQSTSWTLMEAVHFGAQGIRGEDWDTYPVLRFPVAPEVEVVLLDRPGLPPLGAGEATVGPASAAIANAIYDAVGIRLRRLPFTPARVLEALAGSG
jgi:nicotinate dehydrogenase subunit B